MFLTFLGFEIDGWTLEEVAIPSNRVNVSYTKMVAIPMLFMHAKRRNPLKSGQCFLLIQEQKEKVAKIAKALSQSPQIGSMFLT